MSDEVTVAALLMAGGSLPLARQGGVVLSITERARQRATTLGWKLPSRVRVRVRAVPEQGICDPRDVDVDYYTDVDEDPDNLTRAFCEYCGLWIRKLDQAGADQVNQLHPADEDGQPVALAGDWVTGEAGIKCGESSHHEPDEPLTVRTWRENMWTFVKLSVLIDDLRGRQYGEAEASVVEAGTYPRVIDPDTGQVDTAVVNPLVDDEPLTTLIDQALNQARHRLTWWRRILLWL